MSVGIWRFFGGAPIGELRETAAEVEELGFAALWFGEYAGREAFTQAALLLGATSRLTVATGVARFDQRSPLAAEGAVRAYPYFVPPEHTAMARERLGPGKYLAVEQAVLLDWLPTWPASTSTGTSGSRGTTRKTCVASASPTPTSPTAAATAWSTPSSPPANRRRRTASAPTSTRAPTTSASRSWPARTSPTAGWITRVTPSIT